VAVILRLRPPNVAPSRHHRAETAIPSLTLNQDQQSIQFNDQKDHMRQYHYDRVFPWDTTQEAVFSQCGIAPLLDAVLREGTNACVFAYGQTGSGKTTTILGQLDASHTSHAPREHPNTQRREGLIPRTARYIFQQKQHIEHSLSHRGTSVSISFRASFLEIYNETCNDLLNIRNGQNLPLRYNDEQRFYVESLFVIQCDTLHDMMAVIEEGIRNRKVAEHELNADSSRSHSIFTIHSQITTSVGGFSSVKEGKINIVDLCGSERLKKSRSAKHHRTETKHINKSLLTLGQVISTLSDPRQKDRHIRYRDSKLTCLLADSLGGSSACIMIATITPTVEQLDETVNTLNYANKAKNIKNKPQVAETTHEDIIVQLQQQIQQLRDENNHLKHSQQSTAQMHHARPPPGAATHNHNSASSRGSSSADSAFADTIPSSVERRTSSKGFALRNPLHPNGGVRVRPTKLKPLSTHRVASCSPVMSPLDSPRTQNGALTDRSEASELPSGGYYPVNARFGRIMAERDRMEEEIRILKSKLESNRGDSAASSAILTPRRDLLVRPPSSSSITAGTTTGSPVRRRFKSFMEEENKVLKERVQELESHATQEVQQLISENMHLRGLLKKHGITYTCPEKHMTCDSSPSSQECLSPSEDDVVDVQSSDSAHVTTQPHSPVPRRKHMNPHRPRKPVDVDMPQLPTLHTGGKITEADQEYASSSEDEQRHEIDLDEQHLEDENISIARDHDDAQEGDSPSQSLEETIDDNGDDPPHSDNPREETTLVNEQSLTSEGKDHGTPHVVESETSPDNPREETILVNEPSASVDIAPPPLKENDQSTTAEPVKQGSENSNDEQKPSIPLKEQTGSSGPTHTEQKAPQSDSLTEEEGHTNVDVSLEESNVDEREAPPNDSRVEEEGDVSHPPVTIDQINHEEMESTSLKNDVVDDSNTDIDEHVGENQNIEESTSSSL